MRLGSPLPQCTALHCSTGGWNIRCVRTRQGPATCRSAGNGKGDISYNDDAESGIGKLRYNKREEELPEELRGTQGTAVANLKVWPAAAVHLWVGSPCRPTNNRRRIFDRHKNRQSHQRVRGHQVCMAVAVLLCLGVVAVVSPLVELAILWWAHALCEVAGSLHLAVWQPYLQPHYLADMQQSPVCCTTCKTCSGLMSRSGHCVASLTRSPGWRWGSSAGIGT